MNNKRKVTGCLKLSRAWRKKKKTRIQRVRETGWKKVEKKLNTKWKRRRPWRTLLKWRVRRIELSTGRAKVSRACCWWDCSRKRANVACCRYSRTPKDSFESAWNPSSTGWYDVDERDERTRNWGNPASTVRRKPKVFRFSSSYTYSSSNVFY